ncbi:MAG: hypothetical protein J2P51_08015 [Hyphomicrobiaceae bacterium]|nr:hypothetical protein [Hyphomicrobiaceae bacterium]
MLIPSGGIILLGLLGPLGRGIGAFPEAIPGNLARLEDWPGLVVAVALPRGLSAIAPIRFRRPSSAEVSAHG